MAYSRLFQTGFEFNDVDELESIAGFGSGSSTINGSNQKTGDRCLQLNTSCPPRGKAISGTSTLTTQCGLYLRHNSTGTSDEAIIFLIRGSVDISVTYDNSENKVRIRVDGVEEDSESPATLGISTSNEYHHYGLYVYRDGSSGRVALYIDGSLALEFDGDTGTYTNGVYAGGELTVTAWSASAYIDDFWCRYSTTLETEVPPAAYTYEMIRPSADGSTNNWSVSGAASNYQAVDDSSPDDDSTYVYSTAASVVDEYALDDFAVPSGFSISAVIPTVLARKTSSGSSPTLEIGLNEDSTDEYATAHDLTTTFEYYFSVFDDTPDSSSWDDTNIDATTLKIRSAGTF